MLFNVNRDDFNTIVEQIPQNGVVVIASRPAWGEEIFLSNLLQYYGGKAERVELWDLYGDTIERLHKDVFNDSILIHRFNRPLNQRLDKNDFFRQLSETDEESVNMIIGLQCLQRNPFHPVEMRSIMATIHEMANSKKYPVIVYSGLNSLANDHTPSNEDLERIGIHKDIGFIVLLDNLLINPCTKPKVGPFFFINNKDFIFKGLDIDRARTQADKLDNPYSHERLYDDHFITGDYIDFPRGRVV